MRNRASDWRLKPPKLMLPSKMTTVTTIDKEGTALPSFSMTEHFTSHGAWSGAYQGSSVRGSRGNAQGPCGGFVSLTGNNDVWTSQDSLLIKMSAINRDNIECLTSTIRRLKKVYSITEVRGESFLKIKL